MVCEAATRTSILHPDTAPAARERPDYAANVHPGPIHADIIQQFRELGLTCFGNIIWKKITTTRTTGGCTWMGSIYYPRDGYITYEHEYILLFRKRGKARRPPKAVREKSRLTKEQRSAWFRGMWEIPPVRQEEHPAAFPVELPARLIRMFTFWGETVLDPFVGSGTTLQAAEEAERRGIGIELNEKFCEMAAGRTRQAVPQTGVLSLTGNGVVPRVQVQGRDAKRWSWR
jgi:DNA modification methylase